MRVLNLYSGLGGNRKHWKNVEVTALEDNEQIASVYKKLFPKDKLIIGDAHEYLLNHFREYDFIWSSPPCQSHSKMMKATRHTINKYPDLKLYEEIFLLQHFFKGKWIVENVNPYYKPLIEPTVKIGRHLFWSNYNITHFEAPQYKGFFSASSSELKKWLGLEFKGNIYYKDNHDSGQVLRNCVHPMLGLHVLDESRKDNSIKSKAIRIKQKQHEVRY
jgi:DNA (cytosine-5)-methyltransferase 1